VPICIISLMRQAARLPDTYNLSGVFLFVIAPLADGLERKFNETPLRLVIGGTVKTGSFYSEVHQVSARSL
jgi:hypothetical protein